MKNSIKIIDSTSNFEKLKNKIFKNSRLFFDNGIHFLFLNGKKYMLDIKKTFFLDEKIIIEGIISDDEFYVGRIAFEFFPENS
jgi:hypothetical protein